MADDVDQLEIFSCEQQPVEIVYVYITAPFTLKCLDKSGYDGSLLLDPETEGYYKVILLYE